MTRASSLQVHEYKNVIRWTDRSIAQRPAVKRGRMVNRMQGDPGQPVARAARRQRFRHQDAGQGSLIAGPALRQREPHLFCKRIVGQA
jgi:hypothetical protein